MRLPRCGTRRTKKLLPQRGNPRFAIYTLRASALRGGNESHCPFGATTIYAQRAESRQICARRGKSMREEMATTLSCPPGPYGLKALAIYAQRGQLALPIVRPAMRDESQRAIYALRGPFGARFARCPKGPFGHILRPLRGN